jgi:uncharacterized protein
MDGANTISRHEVGRVWVGNTPFESSVLVPWQGLVQPWPAAHVSRLTEADFEHILALQPELVILGSGLRLSFVAPRLYRALIDRRIGVETMDTAAACRTFNVLVTEGRRALAALVVETDA